MQKRSKEEYSANIFDSFENKINKEISGEMNKKKFIEFLITLRGIIKLDHLIEKAKKSMF